VSKACGSLRAALYFALKASVAMQGKSAMNWGLKLCWKGRVWRTGDRIRISVNLVGVKDGFNLWAQRFDSNLGDVFTIQDEVCSAVAEAMHIRVASQLPKAHPRNATAYMQYLKGAYLLKKRRPDGIRRAFEYQQEAIRLEPDWAEP
jgi:adenylate cyclase